MNKKKTALLIFFVIAIFGIGGYALYHKRTIPAVETPAVNEDSQVVYDNTDYGFTFSLTNNWKGYSIVNSVWAGTSLKTTPTKETGTKLLIRHPNWTAGAPYEDIPVLVFTITQWNAYKAGEFAVSAAPIEASELGRNNLYVFALPPRWDFDYSTGYEEAQNIIKGQPLKPYSIK